MNSAITFGTSGHRGIIGQDFTHKHVWAIAQAVADYLKNDTKKTILIGYDPREGNSPTLEEGSFTRVLVETFTSRHIHVDFCKSYTPTPVISWAVRNKHYGGALILTASHNPPNYNGIKFNPFPGQPAPVEITSFLQEKANRYFLMQYEETNTPPNQLSVSFIDLIPEFSTQVLTQCSTLIPATNIDKLSIAIDCKHGACGETWKALISKLQLPATLLNDTPLSSFGDINPNPTYYPGLAHMKDLHSTLSFANDPDGDRHVILDETGTPISPELTATLIGHTLLQLKHPVKGIASTLASSGIVKSFAETQEIDFVETEVGFKYMHPFLNDCATTNTLGLAVESSGGFTLSSHTFEKCGFLPCLLVLFICAYTKEPLSKLIDNMKEIYGTYFFKEDAFEYPQELKNKLKITMENSDKTTLSTQFNTIISIDKRDGVKLNLSNGWLLFRFSGTEPIIRLYAESKNETTTDELISKGLTLLQSVIQ